MKTIEKALIDFDYYYKELKKEKGVLEFKDVEHLCLEILNNDEARKEIIIVITVFKNESSPLI